MRNRDIVAFINRCLLDQQRLGVGPCARKLDVLSPLLHAGIALEKLAAAYLDLSE